MKFKIVIYLSLFICMAFAFAGCQSKGMDKAYEIRETYGQENSEKQIDVTNNQTAPAMKIQLNGAKLLEPDDIMQYGQISMKVKDVKRGQNIDDLRRIMSDADANAFISEIYSRNIEINSQGRFESMDSADQCKLYFIKTEITNNSSSMISLYAKTVFYGLSENKDPIKIHSICYDVSGELFAESNSPSPAKEYMHLDGGKTREVVYVVGLYNAEKYDENYNNVDAGDYLTLCMASTTIDGMAHSGGNVLPAGTKLLKIFEGGKLLYNE